MRRTIIMGAALAVLAGGGLAFAAANDFNSYTASETFNPPAAGSKSHPSTLSIHELWTAKGNNGHNTAPLTKIVAKIYGMKTDGKDFPTCTASKINTAGNTNGMWNKVCPKKSLIGQGPVNSVLVSPNGPTSHGVPCNPYLFIYNGGQGSQVFFFTETPFAPSSQYTCVGGAVKTGSAPAYTGTITQPGKSNGNTWTLTIPLPTTVSTNAGGTGLYASLEKLNVSYGKLTTKKNGKTVAYGASVACKGGKRPWSFTFYAQNYKGQSPPKQTTTIAKSDSC
ncbi:MAG TPA: hypothetical protein VGF70_07760 [Solirubrobacteraceae bacterium]